MTARISNVAAKAACDAIVDLCDGGTPPAVLRIYDGTVPADPDTAITSQTLLAELTMSNPAFGAAADANPGGRATANAITSDPSANATGTATFFRILTGTALTPHIQGTVSATGGGGDLQLATVSIVAAAIVAVTSLTYTQPET